jgi:hypothetical protein
MQQAQENTRIILRLSFCLLILGSKAMIICQSKKLIADKKYTNFTVPVDIDSKIDTAYKVEAIPTKFVIDAEGNIRFKRRGSSDDKEEIVEENFINDDKLLNESKKQ